jgi:hypothetical protein
LTCFVVQGCSNAPLLDNPRGTAIQALQNLELLIIVSTYLAMQTGMDARTMQAQDPSMTRSVFCST